MEPDEVLNLLKKNTETQIDLADKMLQNNLVAGDRLYQRAVSQTLVKAADQILSNPTE